VRLLVPVLTGVFVLAAIALPILRLWLRDGTFGFVAHRVRNPVEALVGAVFAGSVIGFALVASVVAQRPELALAVPPAVTAAGAVVAVVGLGIVVLAQAQMGASWRIGIDDRPTELVESGLYRWSRNPIYAGVLVWLAGMLLVAPSVAGAVLAAVSALAVEVQARLEERHLTAVHGERYLDYAARVGRFFPGVGRLTGAR
jgi:protein-S-isoprenylcysteine O-methyltransferase Ste14